MAARKRTTRTRATASRATAGVQLLRARDVTVPVVDPDDSLPEEILKLRSEFLAGRRLSAPDLQRLLVASSEGGGNGNCNIC